MIRTITCIGLLLLACRPILSAPIQWSEGVGGNGHYYDLVFPEQALTWPEARDTAAAMSFQGISGNLLTITSFAEDEFIRTNYQSIFVTGGPPTEANKAWIGLTDLATEGQYEWITGEAFDYSNWRAGEPNDPNDTADYIELLNYGGDWGWNDVPITDVNIARGYFVEFVPEPSTLALAALGFAALAAWGWRRKR